MPPPPPTPSQRGPRMDVTIVPSTRSKSSIKSKEANDPVVNSLRDMANATWSKTGADSLRSAAQCETRLEQVCDARVYNEKSASERMDTVLALREQSQKLLSELKSAAKKYAKNGVVPPPYVPLGFETSQGSISDPYPQCRFSTTPVFCDKPYALPLQSVAVPRSVVSAGIGVDEYLPAIPPSAPHGLQKWTRRADWYAMPLFRGIEEVMKAEAEADDAFSISSHGSDIGVGSSVNTTPVSAVGSKSSASMNVNVNVIGRRAGAAVAAQLDRSESFEQFQNQTAADIASAAAAQSQSEEESLQTWLRHGRAQSSAGGFVSPEEAEVEEEEEETSPTTLPFPQAPQAGADGSDESHDGADSEDEGSAVDGILKKYKVQLSSIFSRATGSINGVMNLDQFKKFASQFDIVPKVVGSAQVSAIFVLALHGFSAKEGVAGVTFSEFCEVLKLVAEQNTVGESLVDRTHAMFAVMHSSKPKLSFHDSVVAFKPSTAATTVTTTTAGAGGAEVKLNVLPPEDSPPPHTLTGDEGKEEGGGGAEPPQDPLIRSIAWLKQAKGLADRRRKSISRKTEGGEGVGEGDGSDVIEVSSSVTLHRSQCVLLSDVFTHYACAGGTSAMDRLSSARFLKLMKECKVLDNVTTAVVVDIAMSKVVRKDNTSSGVSSSGGANFKQFILALNEVAIRKYKSESQSESQDSLDILIEKHIEPHASRCVVTPFPEELVDSSVAVLLDQYYDPLIQVFLYACGVEKDDDGPASQHESAVMPLPRFKVFGQDFNIIPRALSVSDLCSVYRSVVRPGKPSLDAVTVKEGKGIECVWEGDDNGMVFEQFVEALGRMSLIAYGGPSHKHLYPNSSDKIAHLLETMDASEGRRRAEIHVASSSLTQAQAMTPNPSVDKGRANTLALSTRRATLINTPQSSTPTPTSALRKPTPHTALRSPSPSTMSTSSSLDGAPNALQQSAVVENVENVDSPLPATASDSLPAPLVSKLRGVFGDCVDWKQSAEGRGLCEVIFMKNAIVHDKSETFGLSPPKFVTVMKKAGLLDSPSAKKTIQKAVQTVARGPVLAFPDFLMVLSITAHNRYPDSESEDALKSLNDMLNK